MGLPYSLDLHSELTANLPDDTKQAIKNVVTYLELFDYKRKAVEAHLVDLRSRTNGQFPRIVAHIQTVVEDERLSLNPEVGARDAYTFLCRLRDAYIVGGLKAEDITLRLDIVGSSADSLQKIVESIWTEHNPVPKGTPQGVGAAADRTLGAKSNKSSGRLPGAI